MGCSKCHQNISLVVNYQKHMHNICVWRTQRSEIAFEEVSCGIQESFFWGGIMHKTLLKMKDFEKTHVFKKIILKSD